MQINAQAMRDAYHDVEGIKTRLDSLYFKMEEGEEVREGPHLQASKRYLAAKNIVSQCSDRLLAALDHLRTESK